MKSTCRIALISILAICSFTSISAQTRVQKLYGRSLMNGKDEVAKTINLVVQGKNQQPLAGAHITIVGYDLEWETDEEGKVTIILPKEITGENIEIEISSRKYFLRNIYVSFQEQKEIDKPVKLKYNHKHRCFRNIICPAF